MEGEGVTHLHQDAVRLAVASGQFYLFTKGCRCGCRKQQSAKTATALAFCTVLEPGGILKNEFQSDIYKETNEKLS